MKVKVHHRTAVGGADRIPFFSPYAQEDDLLEVYAYESSAKDHGSALESAWYLFNIGHEQGVDVALAYREKRLRSLSVGDVVEVDGVRYACNPMGWARVVV